MRDRVRLSDYGDVVPLTDMHGRPTAMLALSHQEVLERLAVIERRLDRLEAEQYTKRRQRDQEAT